MNMRFYTYTHTHTHAHTIHKRWAQKHYKTKLFAQKSFMQSGDDVNAYVDIA